MHNLTTAQRRLLFVLFVGALLVRALVPSGWMPVTDAAGPRLALCDGAMAATSSHAMTMRAIGHHDGKVPDQHHQGAPDHPCAFAGATAAVELPALAVPPRYARLSVPAAIIATATAPGRGLAAPPPPPTGPPAFA